MIDYTNEGFILPIEKSGIKGYASVNSILYRDEDGLDVTGNYFVYLMHPEMGSTHFILEPTTSHSMPWKKVGGAIWIQPEILQQIINEIVLRKK